MLKIQLSKKLIKSLIHAVGLDIRRLSSNTNATYQTLKGLNQFGVDTVFDIGANTGEFFASELRSVGFKGRIISFEPLSDAYQKLSAVAERDKSWIVHPRCAIGDIDGYVEINIAGNSVSSSLLPMLDAHSKSAVDSAYIGKEKVPIARLDSVASAYLYGTENYFIKIDTQGFEWQVLDGGRETLAKAQGVLCELSLIPLYKGQRLWLDIIERLESEGFTLWSLQEGFTDEQNGRTMQVDAIFFRLK